MVEILNFNLNALRCLLLWPTKGTEDSKLLNSIRDALHFILLSPTTFAFVADLYRIMKGMRNDVTDLTENLVALTCTVALLYILVVYRSQRAKIMDLLKTIGDLHESNPLPDAEKIEERVKRISAFLLAYCAFACSVYFFLPFFFVAQCEREKENAKYGREIPCGLFTRLWYPFRFDYFPVFEIVEALLVYLSALFAFAVLTISLLHIGLVMHIVGHVGNLKRNFGEAFRSGRQREMFNKCARYHIRIIEVCETMDDCFKNIMFIHTAFTSVILGILCFEVLKLDTLYQSFRFLLHLLGWILTLFMGCSSGQALRDEGESVADAAYGTDWAGSERSLRQDVYLVVMRAQRPILVHTGAFGVLSKETFVAIISTAFSYFTLLASFQQE